MRICREINKTASGINRAVSKLRVAYLVFPGTAMKPWKTPDLKVWNARCASFLEELGGNGKLVFQWENNIPPWPVAFVTPSATPTSPGALLVTPTALPSPISSPITQSSATPTSPGAPLVTPTALPSPILTPAPSPITQSSATLAPSLP